jgi:hypothetical protein
MVGFSLKKCRGSLASPHSRSSKPKVPILLRSALGLIPKESRMPYPPIQEFDDETLCQLIATFGKHCWLPNVEVVRRFDSAVFPTERARKGKKRFTVENGTMSDDNTTPRWALAWSHGIRGHGKGWSVCHVWDRSDATTYTRLSNLALVRECFASLTDKAGPLVKFLRYHAATHYNWTPGHEMPEKPPHYDAVRWNYLQCRGDGTELVMQRLNSRACKRRTILRGLMCSEMAT